MPRLNSSLEKYAAELRRVQTIEHAYDTLKNAASKHDTMNRHLERETFHMKNEVKFFRASIETAQVKGSLIARQARDLQEARISIDDAFHSLNTCLMRLDNEIIDIYAKIQTFRSQQSSTSAKERRRKDELHIKALVDRTETFRQKVSLLESRNRRVKCTVELLAKELNSFELARTTLKQQIALIGRKIGIAVEFTTLNQQQRGHLLQTIWEYQNEAKKNQKHFDEQWAGLGRVHENSNSRIPPSLFGNEELDQREKNVRKQKSELNQEKINSVVIRRKIATAEDRISALVSLFDVLGAGMTTYDTDAIVLYFENSETAQFFNYNHLLELMNQKEDLKKDVNALEQRLLRQPEQKQYAESMAASCTAQSKLDRVQQTKIVLVDSLTELSAAVEAFVQQFESFDVRNSQQIDMSTTDAIVPSLAKIERYVTDLLNEYTNKWCCMKKRTARDRRSKSIERTRAIEYMQGRDVPDRDQSPFFTNELRTKSINFAIESTDENYDEAIADYADYNTIPTLSRRLPSVHDRDDDLDDVLKFFS